MDNKEKLKEIKRLNAALEGGTLSRPQYDALADALRAGPAAYAAAQSKAGLNVSRAKSTKNKGPKTKAVVCEKSLPLAIGLNFIFPGLGYFYLGDAYRGVLAVLVGMLILLSSPIIFVIPVWIGLMAVFSVDMFTLYRKRERQIQAETMKTCPHCAELVLREAVLCKHCGSTLQ